MISKIRRKIEIIKNKASKKEKKNQYLNKKALFVCVSILISVEFTLWIMEINDQIDEPYLWGSRNIIAFKINDCRKLFNSDENEDKIRVVAIGDSYLEAAFDPNSFDEFFNNKTISYNFGLQGCAVPFQSFIIQKLIIPKLKPDIVIWSLSVLSDFKEDSRVEGQEKANLNNPMARYYSDNLNDITIDVLPDYLLLKLFRIYKYRLVLLPDLFDLNEDLENEIESYQDDYVRGFDIHYERYNGAAENLTEEIVTSKMAKGRDDDFFAAINALEKEKIDFLVVTKSPYYSKTIFPEVDEIFDKLDSRNFLDLDGNLILSNSSLHYNRNHLNYYGAQVHTNYLCEKLEQEEII